MNLPPCHSRRKFPDGGTTYFCAHPKMHSADQLVTAEVCRICDFWQQPPPAEFRFFDPAGRHVRRTGPCFHLGEHVDWKECATCGGHVRLKEFSCSHLLHNRTTHSDCLQCRDYESPLSQGTVREWAVGITTAAREVPTLERTLQSLAAAGWSDVRLFAEPGSEIPQTFSELSVTRRHTRQGAFPNWYLGLAELVMSSPGADAYLMCQDDVLFSRGLRFYLEANLWPAPRLGMVSLYCPSHSARHREAGLYVQSEGWDTWGALAYVLPNAAARAFLAHPLVVNHRFRRPGGDHQLDSLAGAWCQASGLAYYVHEPSLAQHIGDTSTLFPGARNSDKRHAAVFLEEVPAVLP